MRLTHILYVDSQCEVRDEVWRALGPLNARLQFACTREEAYQMLSTAKAQYNLPDIVFLSWKSGSAAEALRTIKSDFTLRTIPVIVLAPESAGSEDIRSIYDLHANAVVIGDGQARVGEEMLRRIGEFWICTAEIRHP